MFRPAVCFRGSSYTPARQYHGHVGLCKTFARASLERALKYIGEPESAKADTYITRSMDLAMNHALASDLLKQCFENKPVNWTYYDDTGAKRLIKEHRVENLERPEIYEAYDRRLAEYKNRLSV